LTVAVSIILIFGFLVCFGFRHSDFGFLLPGVRMLQRLLQNFRCDLAVDLGTANTLVGIPGEGLVLDEPSVVAVDQSSGKVLSGGAAVGHMARQMQGRTPQRISVVRPLAGGVVTDFVLCEAMLRYFLRKARPPGWRLKPRVLVGVPGSITPVEKRAVFNSVQRAGAGVVWVMSEAKAAAIGGGLPIAEPLASMVCDVGGGTTEVAVMSLGDTVAAQSVRTGGDRMDRAIIDYLRRHYSLRIGLPAAERLRIDIGSAFPLEEELVAEISGADAASGLPRRATISSEEVRHALEDPLEEIVNALRTTLDQCSPDLAADLMQHGMVLCGGGGLLRRTDRFLAERTGVPVRLDSQPLATVVKGLLICLEHREQWKTALESSDEEV
jgi:rod shape-determining protein MreB